MFTGGHSTLSGVGPDHRELWRRSELQSLSPLVADQSHDLPGLACGHRRRRRNALRLSPADARLDDLGLCEWADPGHIWSDRPAPVHYCCHDHQFSRGVPDHVHRRVTRVLRLHVWVRTGDSHRVTSYDHDFVEFSDSDGLLRGQRNAHRFGHLSRRLRQLLLRPVLPDGRFRLLRCKRQPEHRPGQLLRERHLFGGRQFHGLVIERRIHRTRAPWRHRLAPQGLDLELDPPRRQAVLVVPTRRAARIRSRWPLWSRRRKRTRTMCPSPNKPRPSWKTRCTSGIASLAFCRSKPRRTPARDLRRETERVAPWDRTARCRLQRAQTGQIGTQLPAVQRLPRAVLPQTAWTRVWSSARADRSFPP